MNMQHGLNRLSAKKALAGIFGLASLVLIGTAVAESEPLQSEPPEASSACLSADDPEQAWGDACVADSQGAVPPWIDYDQQVKESSRLAALEFGLAGEQVNHYNGATVFSVVDVDLPGNFDLPVRLVRKLSVEIQPQDQIKPYDTRLGGAGNWDVDVPWMAATYPDSIGWNDQRCSLGSVPPLALGPNGRFQRGQVWHGITVHVPEQGDRRAMGIQTGIPQPSAGGPYRLTSAQRDFFSCIPMKSGLTGEGFRMTTGDGIHYDFDVAVTRTASKLVRPLKSNDLWEPHYLERTHYYLLASRIEDRHGNTVTIDYNSAGRPTRIFASDGREIILAYTSGRLSSVTANGRVWEYQYQNSELSSVELPDGSQWSYTYSGNLKPPAPAAWEDLTLPWCKGYPAAIDASYTVTATHPGGARAEFEFANRRHYRSGVHATECIAYGQGLDAVYDLSVPHYFDVMALTEKTLSGPGLQTSSWSYDYGFSFAQLWGHHTEPPDYPCADSSECQQDKLVTITQPDESQIVERYGVVYRHNDGRLLGRSHFAAGGSTALRAEEIEYLPEEEVANQPFHGSYGTVLGGIGDPITAHIRPVVESILTQDDTTYTRSIQTFDELARAQTVTEMNSTGASRQVETLWHDHSGLWVLGQVEKITVDNTVSEQTSYTSTTALPFKHWQFGRLAWTREYYSDGTLQYFTDGNSNTTELKQWHRGIPGQIEHADGSSQTATIDDNGWIDSVADEVGATTSYQYDAMGRLARTIYPQDAGMTWQDTEAVFEVIDQPEYGIPAGHWRQTTSNGRERRIVHYDALWRPLVEEHLDASDPASTRTLTTTHYDAMGREVFTSWPAATLSDFNSPGPGTHTGYDALDRVVSSAVDSELGALLTTTEYLSNNRIRVTNPKGHVTETRFQAFAEPELEHPLAVTFAAGSAQEVTTTVTRDVFGYPLTMEQAGIYQGQSLSTTHSFGYNAHHQLCRHTGPETASTAFGYDGAGNLAWKAEGLAQSSGCPTEGSLPAGSKISYQYDARNRLTSELYPSGTADKQFSYYANGRLEEATRSAAGGLPASSWSLQWYQRGLLQSETLAVDGHSFTFGHRYNSEGHADRLDYPSGQSVSYNPNGLGQPTRLGSFATGIAYAPAGQPLSFAYGNSVQAQYGYNTRQLRSQTRFSHSGTALMDRALQYDPNGNLTAIDSTASGTGCAVNDTIFCSRFESGSTPGADHRSFVYDELDRLLEVINPQRPDQFSYDPLGNLRSASDLGSWSYDASNRVSSRIHAGTSYPHTWDERGNLTHDGERSYTWNRTNELVADGSGGQYAYDANGWRVYQKQAAGAPIYSVYDHQQRLMVRLDAQTGTRTEFIYLGRQPIARTEGNQTTWIHPDYQNSPLLETSSSGAITRQPVYLGYGRTDSEGMSEIPGYTGAAMDEATGQAYLGARYLYQNRFTSPDPAGLDPTRPAGLNRYAYADNNPVRYVDPDGHSAVAFIGGVFTETLDLMTGKGFDGAMLMGSLKDGYDGEGDGFGAAAFQDATTLIPGSVFAGAAIKIYRMTLVARAGRVTKGTAPIKTGSAGGSTAGQRFPQSVREQAFHENPSRTCVFCRREGTGTQVDHAIPRARGGNATIDNAQLACPHCNASKGARDLPVNPPRGYEGPWPPPWWPQP